MGPLMDRSSCCPWRRGNVRPVFLDPIQTLTPLASGTNGCPARWNREGNRPQGMLVQVIHQHDEFTTFIIKWIRDIHKLSLYF